MKLRTPPPRLQACIMVICRVCLYPCAGVFVRACVFVCVCLCVLVCYLFLCVFIFVFSEGLVDSIQTYIFQRLCSLVAERAHLQKHLCAVINSFCLRAGSCFRPSSIISARSWSFLPLMLSTMTIMRSIHMSVFAWWGIYICVCACACVYMRCLL